MSRKPEPTTLPVEAPGYSIEMETRTSPRDAFRQDYMATWLRTLAVLGAAKLALNFDQVRVAWASIGPVGLLEVGLWLVGLRLACV